MNNRLMNRWWYKASLTLAMTAGAGLLFFYTVDREFINLSPTPGVAYRTTLEHGRLYEQRFVATRGTISRLGLFMQPLAALPSETITLSVWRESERLGQATIATAFLDSEGFTQVVFLPPLQTRRGETLRVVIDIPAALHQKVGVQRRQRDDSFNPDDAIFFIDGQPHEAPLAYQAYARFRPPLARQLALLFLAAAVWLVLPQGWRQKGVLLGWPALLATLVVVPAILVHHWPGLLWLVTFSAGLGMMIMLRGERLATVSQIVGASSFALTTWFVLQYSQGRNSLLLAATLPWLVAWLRWKVQRPVWAVTVATLIVGATLVALSARYETLSVGAHVATFKDIYLDPNQVPSSLKIPGSQVSWDHFGSYLGSFVIGLAGIGILKTARQKKELVALAMTAALVSLLPQVAAWLAGTGYFAPAHLIILLTFALVWAGAWGMETLRRYLGPGQPATIILSCIAVVILLDLLLVSASVLEFVYQ